MSQHAAAIASLRLPAVREAGREVALGEGALVAARVAKAPGADGGRGLLSLAGVLLEARLPAGVREGQRLTLRVERGEPGQLLLRVVPGAAQPADDGAATARLAGLLALSGDGELVRVAAALAGPDTPLALPGHAAAELRIDGDEGSPAAEEAAREGGAVAGFVLHAPETGAIEVTLRLEGGVVRASVTVPAPLEALAGESLPALVSGLERATGRPAGVAVGARATAAPAPRPPAVPGGFDALA